MAKERREKHPLFDFPSNVRGVRTLYLYVSFDYVPASFHMHRMFLALEQTEKVNYNLKLN